MAYHTVMHSCGHAQKHRLFGSATQRESKVEWLEEQLCKDCWLAQQPDPVPEIWIRPAGEQTEIIVLRSFHIKDILKSRGYRYGRFWIGPGSDDLYKMAAKDGNGGWHILVSGDKEGAEVKWLQGQDWYDPANVKTQRTVGRLIAAAGEGRPELYEEP